MKNHLLLLLALWMLWPVWAWRDVNYSTTTFAGNFGGVSSLALGLFLLNFTVISLALMGKATSWPRYYFYAVCVAASIAATALLSAGLLRLLPTRLLDGALSALKQFFLRQN